MNALVVLIPVTLLVLAVAVAAFFWAVRHGQFRNLEIPEILPLLDDRDQATGETPSDPALVEHHAPKET